MFRSIKNSNIGTINHNDSYEGESIEEKVERFVNGNEPITDSAPLIYTERKDGVRPEYNIRTDRFEIGLEAMDYVTRSERAKTIEMWSNKKGNDDVVSNESTQATDTISEK